VGYIGRQEPKLNLPDNIFFRIPVSNIIEISFLNSKMKLEDIYTD
jgi:hypothetical protein